MEVVFVTSTQVATLALREGAEDVQRQILPQEVIPTPVTRVHVIAAIVAETDCKAGQAASTIDWIRGFVNRARLTDYATQYPTEPQMRTVEYRIFDKLMPHGTAPATGSAADLVNQLVLDPARGETSLWHDQERQYDRVWCHVKVSLVAVR